MSGDSLGDRMKRYEEVSYHSLMRRTPVIIRIDGKAFHTFTKCLPEYDPSLKESPYSVMMYECMAATCKVLLEKIQNARFIYSQSDEISILLKDWDTHETQQWFDGNLQKLTSVSASLTSSAFNYFFDNRVRRPSWPGDLAFFDSRAFNLPESEVVNYFIWRQQDASRNSVQMFGRHYFSHKQLHQKNVSQIQDMLMAEHNFNWNNAPTWMKRGFAVYKNPNQFDSSSPSFVDSEIPLFTQDRDFIGKYLEIEE